VISSNDIRSGSHFDSSPVGAASTEFIAPQWAEIFRSNGLTAVGDFWNVRGQFIDEPNCARGGWSAAAKCPMKISNGTIIQIFVKRQRGYQTKTWRHPFRGEPTLQREFRNLEHCATHSIPVPAPIYFALTEVAGYPSAILITEELIGFEPLHVYFGKLTAEQAGQRKHIMRAVGRMLGRLHDSGIKHGCFYPKHVFVSPTANVEAPEIRFIDVEKARPFVTRRGATTRDTGTLLKRLPMCSAEDFSAFRAGYAGE
jgi:tRNA A-37 threonylcarbamoyl transferase component Bud32